MNKNLAIALIIIGMLLQMACTKKTVTLNQPADQTSAVVVGSHIASDVSQTLNGTLSGYSLTSGFIPFTGVATVNLTNSLSNFHKTTNLSVTLSSGCNVKSDSSINKSIKLGDTTVIYIVGLVSQKVLCNGTVPAGIFVVDTFRVNGETPKYSYSSAIYQNIFLQKATPGSAASQTRLDGNLDIKTQFNYKSGIITSETHNFTFTDLVIDNQNGGDIISGKAGVAVVVTSGSVIKNYQSIINFAGGYKATISINNTIYTIDLIKGLLTN